MTILEREQERCLMILADTSFIIDILRGNKEAKKLQERYTATNQSTVISTISLYELFIGVSKAEFPNEEEEKINKLLNRLLTTEFDEMSAKEAGSIYVNLKHRGELIGSIDILLAGIAKSSGIPIITRNDDHFKRIQGLDVITY